MVEPIAGLSAHALEAIAELERRVVAADGGRLKLEWGTLRTRAGDRVEDLLWWDGDRLLGFLGLYGSRDTVELAGMVAPDARRRGIGTALLDAAMPLCDDRGARTALLIVPRASVGGRALAERRGGVLHHSEHALVRRGGHVASTPARAVQLREASAAERPDILRLLARAFREPEPRPGDTGVARPDEPTFVVEVDGNLVGTLRVARDAPDEARIYAFAVEPAHQGAGIGRAALAEISARLEGDGVRTVGLEVDVANERALGLYTSVGFEPVTTEDYYALRL